MKKPTIVRRTFADIRKLPIEDVQAELAAIGIRPIEFVPMDDERFFQHPQPRLELWQRYDWMAYAPIARDPFVASFYERNPADDLPTTHGKQLYEAELKTYVESLTRAQLVAQLKEVTVDERFDRKPEPSWSVEDFRTELLARITKLEAPTGRSMKGKSA